MNKDVTRLPITLMGFLGLSRVNINQDMCLVSQAVRRHQNHSTDYMCVQGIILNTFLRTSHTSTLSASSLPLPPNPPSPSASLHFSFKSMTSSLISMFHVCVCVYIYIFKITNKYIWPQRKQLHFRTAGPSHCLSHESWAIYTFGSWAIPFVLHGP